MAQAPSRPSATRSRILAARRGRNWTTISSSHSSSAARSRCRPAERLALEATRARGLGTLDAATAPVPDGRVAAPSSGAEPARDPVASGPVLEGTEARLPTRGAPDGAGPGWRVGGGEAELGRAVGGHRGGQERRGRLAGQVGGDRPAQRDPGPALGPAAARLGGQEPEGPPGGPHAGPRGPRSRRPVSPRRERPGSSGRAGS